MVGSTFLSKLFKRDSVLPPAPAVPAAPAAVVTLGFVSDDDDEASGSLHSRASVHIERPEVRSEKPRLVGALKHKTRRLLLGPRDEDVATIENVAGLYIDELTRIRAARF